MHKMLKHSTILLLALSLFVIPLGGQALAQAQVDEADPSAGSMTYDLVVMRPLGAAATILGSAAFVLSLPFTAISKTIPTATEKLVTDPFHFTITRPLGTW